MASAHIFSLLSVSATTAKARYHTTQPPDTGQHSAPCLKSHIRRNISVKMSTTSLKKSNGRKSRKSFLLSPRSSSLSPHPAKSRFSNRRLCSVACPLFLAQPITFHQRRHSFATLLAANGIDILTISKMLTHKSVKNTQIYAKVVDERAREAANVISLK